MNRFKISVDKSGWNSCCCFLLSLFFFRMSYSCNVTRYFFVCDCSACGVRCVRFGGTKPWLSTASSIQRGGCVSRHDSKHCWLFPVPWNGAVFRSISTAHSTTFPTERIVPPEFDGTGRCAFLAPGKFELSKFDNLCHGFWRGYVQKRCIYF